MKHYLGTEVYLSQKDYRAEIKKAYKEKMLKAGYIELTRDIDYRGKIELVASKEGMLGTANIEKNGNDYHWRRWLPIYYPAREKDTGLVCY